MRKDAVQSAARLADLDDFEVVVIKRPLSARERILKKFNRLIFRLSQYTDLSIKRPTVWFYRSVGAELKQILQLNDPQGVYAYCLTCEVQ
jgi:protease-4